MCGLCNRAVDFIIREDRAHQIRFASLQGPVAKKYLLSDHTQGLNTLVLMIDDQIYERSDAVFKILSYLGGSWRFLVILKVIPRAMRDKIYDFIAQRRYRWFGKKESCRLPAPEEKAYFL